MAEPTATERKVNLRFSELEDRKLQELVGQFGPRRWKRIAQFMPGRDARQCRDRYNNYLSPDFYNSKWTQEDDLLLYEKYKLFGPKWTKITEFFPGKNANNIKNRWNYWVSNKLTEFNSYLLNKLLTASANSSNSSVDTANSPSTFPSNATTQLSDQPKPNDPIKLKTFDKIQSQPQLNPIPLVPENISTSNQGLFSSKFQNIPPPKDKDLKAQKLPSIQTMLSLIKE